MHISTHRHHFQSVSTEKLSLLVEALEKIPVSTLERISEFSLTWAPVDGCVVPVVQVKFK